MATSWPSKLPLSAVPTRPCSITHPATVPFAGTNWSLSIQVLKFKSYASDITRTYAVVGRFNPEQHEISQSLMRLRLQAIECCAAGTEWRDGHRADLLRMADGLVQCGLLRGEPEALVERGAQSVFFPHGIGHMVGLGIRDAGGPEAGRETNLNEFPRLRVDLPLAVGLCK